MLSNADRSRLEAGKLFGSVGLEEVGHLLDACNIETIAPGAHLLEPGVPNYHLYLVLDGELLVYPGGAGLPEHVALGLGDCVGEISLIDGQQVSALVVPSRETRLLVISHDILWAMIERSHGIALNLLGILAGRLRNDNLALVANQADSLEFELAVSVDALTGLHNRRWMQDAFTRAMQRCERDATPLCLILVDIDNFRRFNGKYGHVIGDGVLRQVANNLVEGLRSQDLLVRYGGEEFALLLPETSLDHGRQIAERLRISVANHAAVAGNNVAESVTISCGVAGMGVDNSLDTLLAAADEALLRAKHNGRNRVEGAVR
ncbi:MAG: GGDEF domain-containing protein [Georgfuchsia sp.]